MLIGSTEIDYNFIKRNVSEPDRICMYAEDLVPVWARHLPNITDNQKYYLAIRIRNAISIPYKLRSNLVKELTKGVSISGLVHQVTTIEQIIAACDTETLARVLEEEKKYVNTTSER